jgi:nitroreductase
MLATRWPKADPLPSVRHVPVMTARGLTNGRAAQIEDTVIDRVINPSTECQLARGTTGEAGYEPGQVPGAAPRTRQRKHTMMQGDSATATPDDSGPSAIDMAISARMSVRAFTGQAVARDLLEALLTAAARSTDGSSEPPCVVHVLQGQSLASLCEQVCVIHDAVRAAPALLAQYPEPYDYYPEKWASPYIDRRRENGWGLYGLLGIGKADKDKMHAQHQRNFRFFDAPVGLVFTMDAGRGGEQLLLCGRFIQSVMLQARLHGLHTCPQAAWNMFANVILPHVGAEPGARLVCCMALGYADPQAVVNTYHTPRLPVPEFSRWLS